jgi:hypothetical protein
LKTRTDDHFYRQDGTNPQGKKRNRSLADRLFDYAQASGAEIYEVRHANPHAPIDGEAVPLNIRACDRFASLASGKVKIVAGSEALMTVVGA